MATCKSTLILCALFFSFTPHIASADAKSGLIIQETLPDTRVSSTPLPKQYTNHLALNSKLGISLQSMDSGIQQIAYLKAINTGADDWLGNSVAISDDTMVVGAPLEDSNATGVNNLAGSVDSADGSGAVYVFIRNGNSWVQQAYLKASNTASGDQFGYSVAISGDTIIVGAPHEDGNGVGVNLGNQSNNSESSSGAVYAFTRTAGNWTQQAYIKASNSEFNDRFGKSVSISDDTLVVGAYLEDSSAAGTGVDEVDNTVEGSGAAYVFIRNAEEWSQQAFLKASNAGATDYFGRSVAISDNTIIVGAENESSNASQVNGDQNNDLTPFAGAAYVFTRSGNSWNQQAYLKASNSGFSDRFGYSVAISGETVAVGAYLEDSNDTGVNGSGNNDLASGSGAAYTFIRATETWTQDQYFKASNTDNTDLFGFSVAISGDTLLVGSRLEDSDTLGINGDGNNDLANSSGAAYLYIREAGSWSQPAYIKASNTGEDDKFGAAVAVSGNMLIIGALNESSDATEINGAQDNDLSGQSGAAYVFNIDNSGLIFSDSFE